MTRVRTFIAVEIEPAIRDRLVALQDRLAQHAPDVKWTEPENLHVTLLFLGEVDLREVTAICRRVAEGCEENPPFALTVATTGCFPNLRRPRTLWVGVTEGGPELTLLHDTLETGLEELGCYRREARQYTPHITLGRLKSDQPTDKLSATLLKLGDWQGGTMTVREVHVMSSELTPKGPIYTILGRAKLR